MDRFECMLRVTSSSQGQLKGKLKASKDDMKAKMMATINPSQEEMKTAVYAIQSAQTRFEETASKQVEGGQVLIYK